MTVLSATAAATMIVGMLAGCGGKTSATKDADGATVIKFGINVANPAKQEPATNAIVEAFNKENKGKYKVQFEAADTESHNKNMKLEASDGTLPRCSGSREARSPISTNPGSCWTSRTS